MSPEERQEVITALRSFAHDEHSLLSYAADELERLTREREMLLNSIYRESERAQEALAQSNAEPKDVRPVWVEPIGNWTGEYRVCIETSAQVCTFDVGPLHFADAIAKAINGHVKLAALAQSKAEPASQPTEPECR